MSTTTEIEKQNLEAHVELCAERYKNLETKLENLESRMDKLESHIVDIKDAVTGKLNDQNKQTISIFVSIGGAILAAFLGFVCNSILNK
jgi:predicted  nucleic acid-binding Zn-ribbon protein